MSQDNRGPVVVGVDASDQSVAAAKLAAEEARLRGTDLHVVHCADITPAILHLPAGVTTDTVEIARREHQRVHDRVGQALPDVPRKDVGLEGYPPDQLADYAESVDATLLVLGSRGRGRVAGAVLGSTSLRCLEQAGCPVLIVK